MLSNSALNQQLKSANIQFSASELQGFLSGLICGGVADQSWQTLLYQFSNDNQAYPSALLQEVSELYQDIKNKLADTDSFEFELGLSENENVFRRADELAEWINHFLLGLGLTQPQLDKQTGEIGEAIGDLQDICLLSYEEEEDDPEELADSLEELIEYVRTIVALFFTHFRSQKSSKTLLH